MLYVLSLVGLSQGQIASQKGPQLDSTDIVEVLRKVPGVVKVEVLVKAERPTRQIIHLRDYHYISKELFALDIRQAAGKKLTDQEVERHYAKFLDEVEAVQKEQVVLLRALIEQHGLKRILAEGLTPKDMKHYKGVLAAVNNARKDILRLQKDQAEVKGLAPALDEAIEDMTRKNRLDLLELGAAGRLQGKLEVLPLDDEALLDAACPVRPDGRIVIDPEAFEMLVP